MRRNFLRVRVGSKRQITLPQVAASTFGINAGDELEARIWEDRIELRPMISIPKDQAWFWTPEWQAREREAEAALAAGDYTNFSDADALVAGLRKK